jgi:hypothetical protein
LGYSEYSASPDILGGGDHLRTTCSEEAACSGPKCGQSAGIYTLGQATFRLLGLYFDNYVAEAQILKIFSDFWFLTRVIRKRGRDTRVTSPSGEGRFAVICLTLMIS